MQCKPLPLTRRTNARRDNPVSSFGVLGLRCGGQQSKVIKAAYLMLLPPIAQFDTYPGCWMGRLARGHRMSELERLLGALHVWRDRCASLGHRSALCGMPKRYASNSATLPVTRAERWKARAEECRTLADCFTDPTCAAQLRRLAQSYDQMAVAAEQAVWSFARMA
jgi:hypothetical protein